MRPQVGILLDLRSRHEKMEISVIKKRVCVVVYEKGSRVIQGIQAL